MILPLRIASTVAERYIYFASFGLFFAVVYLFDAFCTSIKNKMAYTLTACIIILLLFIRTIDRNMDWNDYTRFWEHEANTSLVTFQTHYNLGVTYRNQKRYEEALVEFQKSLMLKQDFPQTYFDYALTYQMMNKFPEAIENYLLAIKVDPYSRGSYNNLALISLQQKKYEDAITYMKAALGKFPRDPELYTNLGIVYYNVGDVNNARSSFKAALSIDRAAAAYPPGGHLWQTHS
jgi:tetratricopeptide (TPR) repeat protein